MFVLKLFGLFFLLLAECDATGSRQNSSGLKTETYNRAEKRRGEVFENLLNIYDPSFLAIVWPKITNGVHILVDHSCWEELGVFFEDLTEGKSWAYSVVDASGRYESALFSGNRFWLGSKRQCFLLDKEASHNNNSYIYDHSRDKYDSEDALDWRWMEQNDGVVQKTVSSDRWPPYGLSYTSLQVYLNITKTNINKSYDIILGVCLPSSCSPRDIISLVNFSIMVNDNLKTNKTTSRIAKITRIRRIKSYHDIAEDSAAIILIFITVLLIALVTIATIVDLNLSKCLPYGNRSMTFDLEKYNVDNRIVDKQNANQESIKNEINKLGVDTANKNYMAVESAIKSAHAITQDVRSVNKPVNNCNRCGKYRKQCSSPRGQNLPDAPCPRSQYNSFASLTSESDSRSIFYRLLLCFSLSYCCHKVFNTNTANKDLSLIHGLRILATIWIIYLHVAINVEYVSDTSGDIMEPNNIYYIIATGTIAFDTLFFVSGIFSSHHFFYLKSQYSIKELVGWGGVFGQMLQFICFVINRIIRLLPPYGYVLFLSATLARWLRSTATLSLPDGDHNNCNWYWWRNLLYISNIYPKDEQCMQVSWYLSTESQVHVCGALVCALSAASSARARVCITLALLAVLSATVTDASASYFDFGHAFSNGFDMYTTIIERPWARVAPYFVGVFTGWLVHVLQGKLKVSKVTSSLLWISSASFTIASAAVPFVGLPWLAAWLHLSWPTALLWPVVMGTTNLAGMFRGVLARPPVAALSRLCYGMLLLHPAIARAVVLSLDTSLCSQAICVWVYFTGVMVLTLLGSFVLCLLVEMPFCGILRRLSDCASH